VVSTDGVAAAGSRGRRAGAFIRAAVLLVAVVGVDQLTKHTIASGIAEGDSKRFIPGIIKFVHVRNKGVAFGFFSGGGTVLLVFTGLALIALLVYFVLRPTRPWLWIPTGLLIGGAVGNLIDRVANNAVTDFIKLPAWPAFNVADMAITFGVLSLLWVLEGGRAERGHPSGG
jgi:signal peptidase II